jgi:hypothetical protein
MGLDAVELVIRFEDSFGICISDQVAERLTTPREVTEYIMTQVPVGGSPACLSQQAFYFLRRGFRKRLQLPRNAFRPGVLVEDLVPNRRGRLVWEELGEELGDGVLPRLALPVWLFWLLTFAATLVSISVFYAVRSLWLYLTLFLTIGVTSYFAVVLALVSNPLRTNFRRRFRRVEGLVDYLVLNSPHTFKHEPSGWTRAQVAEVVRAIIVEEIGITNFTVDSHFIKDMHLG